MSTSKIVTIILAAIFLVVAVVFGPRWFTELKIRSQVLAQLKQGLPHVRHYIDGKNYQLQSIDISQCRRSTDGQKYDVQFVISYTGYNGLHTETGCLLVRDEWGVYR